MLNKKVFVSLIFTLGLIQTTLFAQNATVAAGGDAAGSGGTLSYSVGQLFFNSYTDVTGSLVHGLQQPFEIMVIDGINQTVSLACSVYPNPTSDILHLKVDNNTSIGMTYQLYDASGKLLLFKTIENNEASISMQNFVPATYFLKIRDNKKEIKTFKIIKK
jgi:hypothetical protein